MKVPVVLLCALLGVAAGSNCNASFKNFMDCLAASTGKAATGKVLEQEFDDDFVKQVDGCFESKVSSSNSKCVLSRDNLNTDVYGPDGPLQSCEKCRDIAKSIRDRIFRSSDSLRKCFRVEFTKAVVNDLQPCIRTVLNDPSFNIPALPDFDAESSSFLDLIEKSTSHRIMAYSRLAACNDRFPDRFQKSSSCLANKKGFYSKHCTLTKDCVKAQVSGDCSGTFTKTKDATCTCLDMKRKEWHTRLEKVKSAVFNPEKSSAVCASGVNSALGHWVSDFDAISKACPVPVDPNSAVPNLPISKLIDAGCIVGVEAANDPSKQSALLAGFRMVTNVLDALNDRVTIYCDLNCY